MPIRTATPYQIKLRSKRVEALRVIPVVAWMQYFQTVETNRDECRDAFPGAKSSRVSKDREATGAVNQGDRVREG